MNLYLHKVRGKAQAYKGGVKGASTGGGGGVWREHLHPVGLGQTVKSACFGLIFI